MDRQGICPRMASTLPLLVLICCTLITSADVTVSVCGDMYPSFVEDAQVQTSPAPFLLQLNQSSYNPNDVIQVTVTSQSSTPLEGVILGAHRLSGDTEELVGSFSDPDDGDVILLTWYSSSNQTNCAVKSGGSSGTTLSLLWTAPSQSIGDITIEATVIGSNVEFWYRSIGSNISAVHASTDPAFQSQVTPGLSSVPYEGCGESQGCLIYPMGCYGDTCENIVKYETDDVTQTVMFSMRGISDTYLALAISQDKKWGDDLAFTCVVTDDIISVQRGYNDASSGRNVRHRITGVTEISAGHDDNAIYCQFRVPYITTLEEGSPISSTATRTFDLRDPAYMLVYSGDLYEQTDIAVKPVMLPIVADNGVDVAKTTVVSARTMPMLYVAHASLGVVSRLIFGGLCILIPRYFKAPLGVTPGGVPKWAAIHKVTAILCIAINGLGLLLMGIGVGGWTQTASVHALLGIVTMAITALLMITGVVHGKIQDEAKRSKFAIFHNVIGYLVFFLAVVVMLLGINAAVIHPTLQYKGTAIIVSWTVFHAIWWLLYEGLRCFVWTAAVSPLDTSKDVELKESNKSAQAEQSSEQKSGSGSDGGDGGNASSYRMAGLLFCIYLVCLLLFLILTIYFLATS